MHRKNFSVGPQVTKLAHENCPETKSLRIWNHIMSPVQYVGVAVVLLATTVVHSAPPVHTSVATATNQESDNNGPNQVMTTAPSSSLVPSDEIASKSESGTATIPLRSGTMEAKRIGKLLGLELGLGLGPGYGYGYGGGIPFPCNTARLASLGFPYYNPSCYGYSVPSFPYYGGVLG